MNNHIKLAGAVAVAGMLTVSAQAQTTVHHWKMDAWSGDTLYVGGNPVTHGIGDSANAPGQGTIGGNSGDPNVAHDPLYVWGPMENLAGGLISSDVAPSSMRTVSSSGSFNFNAAIGLGGQAFYAADQFGDEFGGGPGVSWTAELFFKTSGSSSGVQTLLWAKEGHAGSHLQLNTPAAGQGGLEFWGWDGFGLAGLSLTTADYAPGFTDGLWHYVTARYNADDNLMSLFVVNEDGSNLSKSQIMANDLILSGGNNNIIIGRQEGENNRFDGLIDEVRLTLGVLPDSGLMAVVPEPGSLSLLGVAAALFLLRRRK